MAKQHDKTDEKDSAGKAGGETADNQAAGTVTSPVSPGEAQAGDRSEMAANLGGPVDVFPTRRRGQIERP